LRDRKTCPTEGRRNRKSKAPKPRVSLVFFFRRGVAIRVFWFTSKIKGNEGSEDGPQEAGGDLWFGFKERGCGRPLSTGKRRLAAVGLILREERASS
jgi:hypothetical protein